MILSLKNGIKKEVDNFGFLVHDNLESLSKNPSIGNYFSKQKMYSFVISKQTTLYYKVTVEELKIELILFWNNKKNPKLLDKYLNS